MPVKQRIDLRTLPDPRVAPVVFQSYFNKYNKAVDSGKGTMRIPLREAEQVLMCLHFLAILSKSEGALLDFMEKQGMIEQRRSPLDNLALPGRDW